MRDLNIPNSPVEGEKEYVAKWQRLSHRKDPYSYRLFSRYVGNDPNITPEGICRRKIETVLNPLRYRPFYEDKNFYSRYMSDLNMPATYLRRIDGATILDSKYKTVSSDLLSAIPATCDRVILKPSVDSCSGRGVMLFRRSGDKWQSANSDVTLSREFLMAYSSDFILQEAVEQHPFMAQFCKTSVNTLRIATYRSVVDEEPHVIGSIMRIGHEGSYLDNAHAGGSVLGLNYETGETGNYLFDQYGNKSTCCNGIDFSKNSFKIPNWDKVCEFAREVAKRDNHNRLLALDIGLDADGQPILIEANVEGFSYWLFMFSGRTVFGKFTDEIIDYCSVRRHHKHLMR
jgi:hypothetical protein